MRHIEPCEYFRVGDVWMSPRGTLYRVTKRCGPWVTLRQGISGKGRSILRGWSEVIGWVRPPDLNEEPQR